MITELLELLLPPRVQAFLARNGLRVAAGAVFLTAMSSALGSFPSGLLLVPAVAGTLVSAWLGGLLYTLLALGADALFGRSDPPSDPR